MAGIWGEPHSYVESGIKGYADLIAAQLNKAKAVEQEQKNPYVGRQALADVLAKEIENKYAPRKNESDIGYKNALANQANVNAKFTPLETYIKAENATRSNSRFGKSYEFMKALNSMDSASKAAYIAQHQSEYNQMLSDLASGEGVNGNKSGENNLALNIMLHELQKQGGGYMTQSQQAGGNAPIPQQQEQPSLKEKLISSSLIGGNQQPEQKLNPLQNSIVNQTMPLDEQPKSNDPDIAKAQEKLQQARFQSSTNQDEQMRDNGLLYATRKANTAANNARVDGAKVLENWLQENHTPEMQRRFRNVASFSGQTGQMKAWAESKLPESMQSPEYKDYKWFNDEFVPNTANTIKQMEKLNGDQRQRRELEKMVNILQSPDLGPKGALETFNKSVGSLQDMSQAIFSSAEIPQAKGLFKRVYNLPEKYKEFVPLKEEKSDMIKVKVDGKEEEIHASQLQSLQEDAKAAGIKVEVVE